MTWLFGWKKRLKITIDHDDVDANLNDFPILVYLSVSSGINDDDVTAIFDELGANSLKIAVTISDGETECYVEIERWDSVVEEAWLWVKVLSVSSIEDTELYIYYDNDHADNTTYVGVPNSTPAENVWDTNFVLVSHMQDDPDNANVRDSTTNNNDGAKRGANEPIEIDGQIYKGQEFDGTNDHINCGNNASLDLTGNFTISMWVNGVQPITGHDAIIAKDVFGDRAFMLSTTAFGVDHRHLIFERVGVPMGAPLARFINGEWTLVTVAFDGTNLHFFINGVLKHSVAMVALPSTTNDLYIGQREYAGYEYYWEGSIDEVRISKGICRSVEWIGADYESCRDHLLIFGEEEIWHEDDIWLYAFDCGVDCILDHIIGWEERASCVIAKKKVIGRCCPTPAPEEGYISTPREIRIIARMDRTGRNCIDDLWDCCDWVRLYDKEGELIDYVWLEEPNYRWDTGLGCGGKPWIVTLGLVCSST